MTEINKTNALDELKAQNKRLSDENKVIFDLLKKYRQILLNFHTICVCNQKSNLDFSVKFIEREYKIFTETQDISKLLIDSNKETKSSKKKKKKSTENRVKVEDNSNSGFDNDFDSNFSQDLEKDNRRHEERIPSISSVTFAKKVKSKPKAEKPCNCEECRERFGPEVKRKRPAVTTPKKTPEGNRLYLCPSCDFESTVRKNWKQHIFREHSSGTTGKRFVCTRDGCGKRLGSIEYLRLHAIQVHDWQNKSLKCEECDKTFATSSQLKNHSLVHLPEIDLQCDYCEFKTKRIHSLKQHVQRFHEKRGPTVECDIDGCGKICLDRIAYQAHKRRYHKEKTLSCDWPGCEMIFKHNDSLRNHRFVHLGVRQFVCEKEGCGKAFKTRRTLSAHKQSHIKKYFCSWPECGQRFTYNALLKAHLNKHQNLRPFLCYIDCCPKDFLMKPQLDHHIRTVHKCRPDPTKYVPNQ